MNRLSVATFSLATVVAVMTLGYATPSYAKPPNCDEDNTHPSCKTVDEGGGAAFKVVITDGLLVGGSAADEPWVQSFGGKKSIGLNSASGLEVGTLTGLSLLTDSDGNPLNPACFPAEFTPPVEFTPEEHGHSLSSKLHQAIIQSGKKGRAEAWFWFHGATKDGTVRVLYLLKLFGDFESGAEWPGAQTLTMDTWELTVENEGKTIKELSCRGEGTDSVKIGVTTPTTPTP